MSRPRTPAGDRFWPMVSVGAANECWPFTGAKRIGGYGTFKFSPTGNNIAASRAAWILTHGEIDGGLVVCHSCDNPPCCNPAHLWLGTNADNKRDAVNKGRHAHGVRVGVARLNPDRVVQIRALSASGVNNCELARRFGVSRHAIRGVVHNKTWREVTA